MMSAARPASTVAAAMVSGSMGNMRGALTATDVRVHAAAGWATMGTG
jgi:hypothetical protein